MKPLFLALTLFLSTSTFAQEEPEFLESEPTTENSSPIHMTGAQEVRELGSLCIKSLGVLLLVSPVAVGIEHLIHHLRKTSEE